MTKRVRAAFLHPLKLTLTQVAGTKVLAKVQMPAFLAPSTRPTKRASPVTFLTRSAVEQGSEQKKGCECVCQRQPPPWGRTAGALRAPCAFAARRAQVLSGSLARPSKHCACTLSQHARRPKRRPSQHFLHVG